MLMLMVADEPAHFAVFDGELVCRPHDPAPSSP